jgi:hypothetical protein
MGLVRQISVPRAARAECTLARVDYEDAFVVSVGPTDVRTAEQWARALLEDAHGLVAGWTAIGLKLSAGRGILGWTVRRSTADVLLLGAESRIGMPAELLLLRRRRSVLFSTFVQKDNALARAVWAATEPIHVPTVRRLLGSITLP